MHILGDKSLGKENLISLFSLADRIRNMYGHPIGGKTSMKNVLEGHTIALLFLEPSTRTRTSFQLAAQMLGAETILLDHNLSTEKGETPEDTIRMLAVCPQISAIVLRHPENKAAERAARMIERLKTAGKVTRSIPLINAGDGRDWHPTQAYLDLYTLQCHGKLYDYDDDYNNDGSDKKRLCGAIFGDLKNARVIHSLVQELAPWRPKLYLIGPEDTALPYKVYKPASVAGAKIVKKTGFEDKIAQEADFYYFVRLQAERHNKTAQEIKELEKLYVKRYGLSPDIRRAARKDAIFLHPGPMLKEMPETARWNSRLCSDEQAENGLWIKAALLKTLLRPEYSL